MTFESDFLEGEEFHSASGWLVEHGSTWCEIFPQKARYRLLSMPSMAAVLKAHTPLPWKSDQIDAEVSDRRHSHTLRYSVEKLGADNFALKSSAQMARPELTRARSNKQLLSLQYSQESANVMMTSNYVFEIVNGRYQRMSAV